MHLTLLFLSIMAYLLIGVLAIAWCISMEIHFTGDSFDKAYGESTTVFLSLLIWPFILVAYLLEIHRPLYRFYKWLLRNSIPKE